MDAGALAVKVAVPQPSLVVLIGTSGSGKSTFAARHFLPTEILSSDVCRGLVADDENDQAATNDAFEVLHVIAAKRLAARRLTVVDATNVQESARRPLVQLAQRFHVPSIAIVLDVPPEVCLERNARRPDRTFGDQVVRRQHRDLRRSRLGLEREGFRNVVVLAPHEIELAEILRIRLSNGGRAGSSHLV